VNRAAIALLFVACGNNNPKPPDGPSSPWQPGPMLPGLRLEAGVTALGQNVVMLGGFDTGIIQGLHITNEVDILDTSSGVWSRLPDAPVAWTHVNLMSAGGTLYLLGGLEGTNFVARGDAFALDPGATMWRPLTPIPTGQERGAAALIAVPPHLYIVGGAFTTNAVATGLDYDITTDTWAMLPDLPSARSHPAGMRKMDGTLIVAGGLQTLDASMPIAETLALPVGSTTWEPLAPMPIAHGGCAYGTIGQSLVCAGGEAGAAALHIAMSYDSLLDQWTMLPDMPHERAGTQGAAVGQRLFVPGGAPELQFIPTDTMDVFDALDTGP
jgi:Kelch motif protein